MPRCHRLAFTTTSVPFRQETSPRVCNGAHNLSVVDGVDRSTRTSPSVSTRWKACSPDAIQLRESARVASTMLAVCCGSYGSPPSISTV